MFTIRNRISKKITTTVLVASLMLTTILFSACTDEEIAAYKNQLGNPSQVTTSSENTVSSDVVSDNQSSKETSSIEASSKAPSSNNVSSKAPTSSKAPVSSKAPTSSKYTAPPKTSSQPTSSKVQSSGSTPINQGNMGAIEDKIIQMVNELRTSVGVAPLAKSQKLSESALIRSDEMLRTGQFSHTRPDGSSCFTTIDAVGYSYKTVGENIGYAKGHPLNTIAQVMFDGWKNSPGHYANMVKADFKEIGISVCSDGTTTYATQHFGTSR